MFNFFNFNIQDLLYRIPAVLVALSFHEWAHAYAAFRLGDPTARNLGRMTINPIKHIDPIGLIFMIIARFGWAKPVPVNPRNFSKPRRDDIFVSVAGVSVNLMLSFISAGVFFFIFGVLNITNGSLETIIRYFFTINLCLAVFNLIPIPPLDGYHVFKNATIRVFSPNFFMALERYGFVILSVLLITNVINSILGFVVDPVSSGFSAFWLFVFGLA